MDGFNVEKIDSLRSPVVVMAFEGWSDTGSVTTDAADQLIEAFSGRRFLEVDAEEYFVFTDVRPHVQIDESGQRSIEWPANEAFAANVPASAHDLIIVRGIEPNLRWREFAGRLAEVLAECGPALVCTLVARPAATPHTRPVLVNGTSADLGLASRYGLGRSMYQGPTGIVGVLHDEMRDRKVPLISLSAGVPHYLNVPENPMATSALLKALEPFLGASIPQGDLDEEGESFIQRVNEASAGDEQIGAYVRSLEEQYEEQQPMIDEGPGPSDLPSADDLLRDVEDFLRRGPEDEQGD